MTQVKATLYLGAGRLDDEGNNIPDAINPHFLSLFYQFVAKRFNGFTVVPCIGYWKGMSEVSRQLVIICDDCAAFRKDVNDCAVKYVGMFGQDSVLVEFTLTTYELVS